MEENFHVESWGKRESRTLKSSKGVCTPNGRQSGLWAKNGMIKEKRPSANVEIKKIGPIKEKSVQRKR